MMEAALNTIYHANEESHNLFAARAILQNITIMNDVIAIHRCAVEVFDGQVVRSPHLTVLDGGLEVRVLIFTFVIINLTVIRPGIILIRLKVVVLALALVERVDMSMKSC